MFYSIRKVNQDDTPNLAKLLEDYIQETYKQRWSGTVEQLEQDIFKKDLEVFVAETSERKIVALVAWINTYDLHHCMKGGDIIDFYVSPPHRGRGAAVFLIQRLD